MPTTPRAAQAKKATRPRLWLSRDKDGLKYDLHTVEPRISPKRGFWFSTGHLTAIPAALVTVRLKPGQHKPVTLTMAFVPARKAKR